MQLIAHWSHWDGPDTSSPTQRVVVDDEGRWYGVLEFLGEPERAADTLLLAEATLRMHAGKAGPDGIAQALKQANAEVYRANTSLGAIHRSRVSATVVAVRGTQATIAHVGRMGAAVVRRGDQRPQECTQAHTVADDLGRAGQTSEVARATSSERLELTRALGDHPHVDPDVHHIAVLPGDRLVLHSHTGGIQPILVADSDDGSSLARRWARAAAMGQRSEATAMVLDARGLVESGLHPMGLGSPLSQHALARHLGRDVWPWFFGLGTQRALLPGEVLVCKGESVDHLYLVTRGALVAEGDRHRECCGRGSAWFPEALARTTTSPAEIRALGAATVLEIPRAGLLGQLPRRPVRTLLAWMRLRSFAGHLARAA